MMEGKNVPEDLQALPILFEAPLSWAFSLGIHLIAEETNGSFNSQAPTVSGP